MQAGRLAPPTDLIELGAVRGAYGLKGWVRILPHVANADVLRATRRWWLQQRGLVQQVEISGLRRHVDQLLAKWPGCETPEAADALKGATVAVARSEFPPPPEGTYYWVDLIDARVVNRAGEVLGKVQGLRNNGAQDLLEVVDGEAVLLIPMIEQYVDHIDVAGRTVAVDWQRDW